MSTPAAALPEILAPAGGPEQLAAAIAAGADAVYLGLGELDARRGAPGFAVADLPALVAQAHAANVRVHLTLNIQIGWRELGRAARTLAWAAESGVDAVLVADPALLALREAFPAMAFHFSTQAGISSSAGVRLAGELGATRVVLARELSLDEIAPCAATGIAVEVFSQGALCFSVSGRCSLTSWVGGRSGNRGTCTSICRVGWSCNGAALARPMDMKDVSAVRVLPRLRAIGVTSLKIEGRLKSPEWVGKAVALHRQALAGETGEEALWNESEALGAYAGRDMTDAYLTGGRVGLVHPDEGRAAGGGEHLDDQDPPRELHVTMQRERNRLRWDLRLGAQACTFETTAPQVHGGRGVPIGELAERIGEGLVKGITLAAFDHACPDLELPRRTIKDLAARIAAWARPREDGIDRLKVVLPEAARLALLPGEPHPSNTAKLNDRPLRARLDEASALGFGEDIPGITLVVELREAAGLERLRRPLAGRLVCALPPVIYEAELPALRALCAAAKAASVPVEANGWDGLALAREAGCVIEGGPGMAVLNPVAARVLGSLGCIRVHACVEADGAKLADLCARCPLPLTIPVFGRPALMTTRAWTKAPPWSMVDAKETVRIRSRQEGPVVVLRPVEAFDWRWRSDAAYRAALLECDLSSATDPQEDWRQRPDRTAPQFNLDRELA